MPNRRCFLFLLPAVLSWCVPAGVSAVESSSAATDSASSDGIRWLVDKSRIEEPVVIGVDEAVLAARVAFAAICMAHEEPTIMLEGVCHGSL
jgi:hypothetical protein